MENGAHLIWAYTQLAACEKGTGLGTNFTLSIPCTKLVYTPEEYAWAAEHGCPEEMTRVSVASAGLENTEAVEGFAKAVKAAEGAHLKALSDRITS